MQIYEGMFLLDSGRAAKDWAGTETMVTQVLERYGARLLLKDRWDERKLAYEIRQRNEADYRFYRFQGEPALLERLDHSLKISDGTLRFRIFKVDPETTTNPPPAAERPAEIGSDRIDRDERRERRPRRED